MAQNPWDTAPIVSDPRQDERERAETRYRNTTGDINPLARPVILPGEEGYQGEGQYLPEAGVVVRQGAWDAAPVVSQSEIKAAQRAAEQVGTTVEADRERALMQGLTFGFADELAGGLSAAGQAARNLGRNLTGQPIEVGAMDYGRAVTDATREANQQFRQERPFQSAAFEVGGGFLSGGLAGTGRGLAGAARTGLVTGGLYGTGTAEGGYADRLAGGALGAAIGGGAGVALQAAAAPIAQRLGSIAAGRAPRPASPVVERAQASRWAGIDPTLAGIGGPITQRAAATLGGNVVAQGPMAAASARAREQTIGAVDRIAGQYGAASGRESAGQILRRGAETGARELRTEGGNLYHPINALEQNPTPIPLSNARQAVDESLAVFTTPELRDWFTRNATDLTQFQNVLTGANNQATFAEARQLRSIVGSMLQDPQVFNSRSQAGLRRLYGALSDDITQGAEQIGGPQAAQALNRADRFYSAARDRADRVLEQFIGADNSSQAYQRLLEISRSTGRRSDWQQLRQLRDSIPADDWNEIGAGVIRSLGGEGEDFSTARFVTEWNKMTPEARRTLFGGAGRSDQFRDLNNLARVLSDQKAASRFYNYSESGNTLGNIGVGSGAAGALVGLGAGNPLPLAAFLTTAVSANLGARALTSPGVARWLASPASQVVPQAQRLATRNADFAAFWNANREAITRALQNPSTGPVAVLAEGQEEEMQ